MWYNHSPSRVCSKSPTCLIQVGPHMITYAWITAHLQTNQCVLGGRIPKEADYNMSRREFVAGVVAVVGAVMTACAGLPVIAYFVSPALKKQGGEEWITLGPMS